MPKSALMMPTGQRRSPAFADLARSARLFAVAGLAVLLVACASGGGQRSSGAPRPGPAPSWETDGPGRSPPADLASVPDAEPVIEPIRSGPTRPYEIRGRTYIPITEDLPHTERGLASWYGRKFQGRSTASGEPYDMYAMTAAHPTLPLPSYVRVRNPANQREVVVRVNDRGPFHSGRIIDLSYTAAFKLDLLRGVAPVEIERITNEEIASGSWRRGRVRTRPEPVVARRPAEAVVAVAVPAAMTSAVSTAAVQVEDLPQLQPLPADVAISGYWVQLGAFRYLDGAENFQRKVTSDLDWIAPALSVRSDVELHRLQAGPYVDREEAVAVAQRLRESLQLVPVIVESR